MTTTTGVCLPCGARFRGRASHCTACHRTFSSDWVGDRHRIGPYVPDERRCLDDDEMRARGWVLRDTPLGPQWGSPGIPESRSAALRQRAKPPSPAPGGQRASPRPQKLDRAARTA